MANHPREFPIVGKNLSSIPWKMIALHDSQCLQNHGYDLAQMAAQGGLTPSEALDVLEDRRWSGKLIKPWARASQAVATAAGVRTVTDHGSEYEAEHEAELTRRVQQFLGGGDA